METKHCYLCDQIKEVDCFNSKRKECKICERGLKLFYTYGITQEQYDDLLEKQNGVCAICDRSPEKVGLLVVDHDHSCHESKKACKECVRGLLCHYCNTGLGLFRDDIDRLIAAAQYVILTEKIMAK